MELLDVKSPGFFRIKLAFFAQLFFLIFCCPSIQAVPLNTPIVPSVSSSQIGIAAAVRGTVKISNQAQVGQIVSSGQAIHLGDEVSTDSEGNLQILLLDQTTFTIGPNSAIVIDKFVYDPATHDGEIKAKVVKGVFRFVTGKIGQKKPQQMEVDLPSGTIGIRGTIVGGEVVDKKSTIVLLGPGENNNTQHRQGSFDLQNGGSSETVNKTGFASVIDGEGAFPTDPFKMSQVDLDRISNALGTTASDTPNSQAGGGGGDSDGDGDGESPTQQSGQDNAMAGESAGAFGSMAALVQGLLGESTKAAQESVADLGTIQDGITRAIDLRSIASGQFHYYQGSVSLASGAYNIFFNIDYGTKKVGGGLSRITGSSSIVDGNDAFHFAIGSRDFPESGDAIFQYNFPQGSDTAGSILGDASATLTVTLNNLGGQVAVNAQHNFSVTDVPILQTDSGSGIASQSSGLAGV